MRNKIRNFKKFVEKHKVAIAITSTAGTCLWLNRVALQQHDDFLKEKDLYNEYYGIDEN